jgi:hypothetical protein
MRGRLRRLERAAKANYISIPQQDGPPKQFPPSAALEAFLTIIYNGHVAMDAAIYQRFAVSLDLNALDILEVRRSFPGESLYPRAGSVNNVANG